MIKLRNIIIYIVVCIIVVGSLKIPELLLNKESSDIEFAVYDKEKKENAIDIEFQNIYLVKAIHEIESGATVEISSPATQYLIVEKELMPNYGFTKDINEEMFKLQEYNILKNINLNENSKYKFGLINKNYRNKENSYTVNYIILDFEETDYILNLENKTGKIIYIAFKKDNLYNKDNKKEMIENFIKYLNLYIIDDWEYEIDEINKIYSMKSKKADVVISLNETQDMYSFSFHIINGFKVIDTN